ncbi:CoA-transferase family III [Dendrothele bispora CBS 962.96]|uniref:CoA-transferase family III n=1 Tax=Dendrothele bispora (strain CBS 962.96) TaxID=1314807 RepID=A0A4S8M2C6_DENBC|nr:CoA-transferase family III [Dendrothele bispora CBS 962.96]
MATYSVPAEAQKLLENEIINNKLHSFIPSETREAYTHIEFQGTDFPSIPVNWRFAESMAALRGFEGAMLNILLNKKYGIPYQKIVINTDHASLLFMEFMYSEIIEQDGKRIMAHHPEFSQKYFPNLVKSPAFYTPLGQKCTNIYKTKDGRFIHTHASLDPVPTMKALDIDPNLQLPTGTNPCSIFSEKIAFHNASDLDKLLNDQHRQAATVCLSTEEFLCSPHGKANAHVGLYEIHHVSNPNQKPCWWKAVEGKTTPTRPLYGLKVIDLTRIIAAPTIGRTLAEQGASLLRITSRNLPDFAELNFELGWGKWNAHLDLKNQEDRERLKELILESDVVISGYRPGVMDKWGFGKEDVMKMCEGRERGIIYVRENCYGWNGPLTYRSGWQQISDAICGVSLEFGRSMGLEEPVAPIFPNADYSTGVIGATSVLQALIERSRKGGSYIIDLALNYYSQWLINSVKPYPPDVWHQLWTMYGKPMFRHDDNMPVTLVKVCKMLAENERSREALFKEEFWEVRENEALGKGVRVKALRPALRFPEGLVKPGFQVGTRPNGRDKPRWPEDLDTVVIE